MWSGFCPCDEKLAFAFAVSTLASIMTTPPVQNALHSPLILLEPQEQDKCGLPMNDEFIRCAERKAGVGAVRDH